MIRHRAPALADVAALAVALERDEQRSATERKAADRRVIDALGERESDRVGTAMAWLDAAGAGDEVLRVRREQAHAAVMWINVLMTLAGVLVGWLTALGAFYYDGSGRVNVVTVLAVFVVLPALLLIPLLLAVLPPQVLRYLPGMGAAAALGRGLAPGRLGLLLLRRLPRDWQDAWARAAGRAGSHRTLYGGIQKWAALRWSQLFALGFQAAAVSAALWLVIFSDLAFGWSTTLTSGDAEVDAARLHAVTQTMAAPWGWVMESAQPSFGLIHESRYYRLVAESVSPGEAARLGAWWRFVVVAMIVYGLLPRIVTLLIARRRLQAHARAAFSASPGLTALLGRLHRARVETTAAESESGIREADEASAAPLFAGTIGEVRAVVNWADVPVSESRLIDRLGGGLVVHAGGKLSLEADRATAVRLAGEVGEAAGAVVLAVKAWEPPLLELVDFVRNLREALGENREVIVVPLGLDEGGRITGAAPAQMDVWRRTLARAGDPWLRVLDLGAEVAP